MQSRSLAMLLSVLFAASPSLIEADDLTKAPFQITVKGPIRLNTIQSLSVDQNSLVKSASIRLRTKTNNRPSRLTAVIVLTGDEIPVRFFRFTITVVDDSGKEIAFEESIQRDQRISAREYQKTQSRYQISHANSIAVELPPGMEDHISAIKITVSEFKPTT